MCWVVTQRCSCVSVIDLFLFVVEEHQHYTSTPQFVDAVSCRGHLGCALCKAITDRDAADVLNGLESVSRSRCLVSLGEGEDRTVGSLGKGAAKVTWFSTPISSTRAECRTSSPALGMVAVCAVPVGLCCDRGLCVTCPALPCVPTAGPGPGVVRLCRWWKCRAAALCLCCAKGGAELGDPPRRR